MRMRWGMLVVMVPAMCFAAVWLDVGVAVYNDAVAREEAARVARAYGEPAISLSSCGGVDIAGRNRALILLLSVPAFFLGLGRKTRRYVFVCYALMGVLAFHWIWSTVRALEYAESYRAELPYLLRVADPVDWTMFIAIGVTLACWAGFALSREYRWSLP